MQIKQEKPTANTHTTTKQYLQNSNLQLKELEIFHKGKITQIPDPPTNFQNR